MRQPKPSSVILDLMSSAQGKSLSAKWLMRIGGYFGFTENTIRVALSRLGSRGLIESAGRGYYRMAHSADAVNDFVGRWRLGESRVVHWRQLGWHVVHNDANTTNTEAWVLQTLGFRQVRNGLFARPDNLILETDELATLARQLGLAQDAVFLSAKVVSSRVVSRWVTCWQTAELNRSYQVNLQRLKASADRLPGLSLEAALVETFNLGGEIVHLLAKDPLLPRSMVQVSARRTLWEEMLNYERFGRKLWAQAQDENLVAEVMPTPRLAAGG